MDFSKEKYEYMLHTWGGFYNVEHVKIHGKKPGYFFFYSMKELKDYEFDLKQIEKELGAHVLMTHIEEGQHVRYKTIAKMKFLFNGKTYDYQEDFGYAYPLESAKFMFEDGNYACDCNRSLMLSRKYRDVTPVEVCGYEIDMIDLEILQVKI